MDAAGAGGYYAGIAGAISVEVLNLTTHTGIEDNAKINTGDGKNPSKVSTGQTVAVAAYDATTLTSIDGALGVGLGVGAAGGVDVGVIKADTLADIGTGATVNANKDITINALAEKTVDSTSVSASGGLGAIAGGISVYSIGNGLDSSQTGRLTTDKGSVNDYADTEAQDGSVTGLLGKSNSSALSGITAGAAGKRNNTGVSSLLTQSAQSKGVAAGIGAGATITAGSNVGINAKDIIDLTIHAGVVSGGAIGLGAGVGIANVSDTVSAFGAGDITIAGVSGGVDVTAKMDETDTNQAYVGSGGILAIDAAVAKLKDTSTVTASLGDNTTITNAYSVGVTTTDNRKLTAQTFGVGVGVVTAGASTASTLIGGSDAAILGKNVTLKNAKTITVQANAMALTADSQAQSAAGGLGLAASGTVADALINTSVDAHTGDRDTLTTNNGTITVEADSTPQAKAVATGINVAAGGAVGVSKANATVSAATNAALGSGSIVNGASLTVNAAQHLPTSGSSAATEAYGAAGGLLFGGNASLAESESNSAVTGSIGDNSQLTISNSVILSATNASTQNAKADGIQAGFVALGATKAEANDNTTTTALMGKGITLNNGKISGMTQKSSALTISAVASIDNEAYSRLGSGGVLSGSGAVAETSSTSQTKASAGPLTDGTGSGSGGLDVNTLTINSSRTTTFNSFVDSINASIAGLSGAFINNNVDSTVLAGVGDQAHINTYNLTMDAKNDSEKKWQWAAGTSSVDRTADNATANVKASTVGLANASAGISRTTVSHNTQALIGAGSQIDVEDPNPTNDAINGKFQVNVLNVLNLQDKGVLHSGGAVTLPKVEEYITVSQNKAAVNFGANAAVTADSGDILAGARTDADMEAVTAVDAWGLAGQPQGLAHVSYTGENDITLGNAATLIANRGNIMLAAGEDTAKAAGLTSGLANSIYAATTVNTWNKTAFPQVISPDADTTVHNNNSVTIGSNAAVESSGDIGLYGDAGTVTLSAKGDAKDVYRETANAIINAFGGDVSTDLLGGETHKDGKANITVDGLVLTGLNSNKDVTIDVDLLTDPSGKIEYDANGNVKWSPKVTSSEGVTYSHTQGTIASAYEQRIKDLRNLQAQYAGDGVAYNAYQSEIEYLQNKLNNMGVTNNGVGTGAQPKISPRQSALNDLASMTDSQQTAHDQMTQDTTAINANTVTKNTEQYLQALSDAVNNYQTAINKYYSDSSAASDADTISNDYTAYNTAKDALATALNSFPSDSAASVTISTDASKTVSMSWSSIKTKKDNLDNALNTYQTSKDLSALNTVITNNNIGSDQLSTTNYTAIQSDQTTLTTAISNLNTDYNKQLGYYNQYQTSITNLNTQLAIAAGEHGYLSNVAPTDPTADFITVNDISITTGSIKIKGDNLTTSTGTGKLNAPNNAKITITNNTPAFLNIQDLTINDQGGRILFNGFEVNNSSDIRKINLDATVPVNFASVLTGQSTTIVPEITITSTYDPNNTTFKDANGIICYSGTTTPIILGQAPDIQLTGSIINLNGKLTVHSAAGNISVNNGIQAGQVDIKADNGDFVLSYINRDASNSALDFYNVGGDPSKVDVSGSMLTAGGITANGSVIISGRYLNINGTIQSGIANWNLTLPLDPILTGTAAQLGVAQTDIDNVRTAYNNDLAASKPVSQYSHYALTNDAGETVYFNAVKDRLEVSMEFAKLDVQTAKAAARNSSKTYSLVDDNGNVGAVYNPLNDNFEINNVSVQGGYIKLYGQILNTSKSAGNLNVLDGYAQFNITNNTGKDIMVNSLDTGRGTAGIIDIQDIQYVDTTYQKDAAGNSTEIVAGTTPHVIETIYTRNNGTITKEQKGQWTNLDANGVPTTIGDSNFNDSYDSGIINVTSGRNTSYSPQAGLEYVYTTGVDQSTIRYYKYSGPQFFGSSDLRIITDEDTEMVKGPLTLNSYILANGTYLMNGVQAKKQWSDEKQSGSWDGAETYNYQYTISNGEQVKTVTNEYTKTKWYTWLSLGTVKEYVVEFNVTTPTKTITRHYMEADNPIKVNFIGSDTGSVTINSASGGNVLLNGNIRNQAGTTTVTAKQSILQSNDTALITTNTLNLTATNGSIGTYNSTTQQSSPIRVAITGNGVLMATAAGDVRVSQLLGDMQLGNITATNGTVAISSEGSITRNGSSLVQGNRIELDSTDGSVGSEGTPLVIKAGFTNSTDPNVLQDYGLKASARGDIAITNQTWSGNSSGDLLIDTVTSASGNVWLTTPGRMLDNNPVEHVDTRTWDELVKYWDALALTEGSPSNQQKQQDALATYIAQQNNAYQTYWNDVNSGKFDSQGNYQITDAERTVLTARYQKSGITGQTAITAQIAAYAQERTSEFKQLRDQGVGGWTSAYQSNFSYDTNDNTRPAYQAAKNNLLNGASWTTTELGVSLSPGTLKQLTDTNPVVKDPNVSGHTVTINAGSVGARGSINLPLITDSTGKTIIDVTKLTPEQKVALITAERSDWPTITNTFTSFTIGTFEPLNASVLGNNSLLTVTANSATSAIVYLASEQDLNLGRITAGAGQEIRIKGGGSVLNGLTDDSPNVIGGNVVLEAATGTIGTAAKPVRLGNTGYTLTARAEGDIYLIDNQDINVDTIFSRNDVTLVTSGKILNAYPGNNATGDTGNDLNISSDSLTMTANAIGQPGQYLKVGLGLTGALDAVAYTGGIYLASPENRLEVDRASAPGDIMLIGAQDLLISPSSGSDGILSSAGSVTLTSVGGSILHADRTTGAAAVRDIEAMHDITLTAGKTIGTTAADGSPLFLDVESGGLLTLSGERGIYLRESDNMMNLTTATSANGSIVLDVAGAITFRNIYAHQGTVTLSAASGDLQSETPDTVNGNIQAVSMNLTTATGGIGKEVSAPLYIDSSYNNNPGTVSASAQNSIYLKEVKGDFIVNSIQSTGDVNQSTSDINLDAVGSILNGAAPGSINAEGHDITLIAEGGSIGSQDKPFIAIAHGNLNLNAHDWTYYSFGNQDMVDNVNINVTSGSGVVFDGLHAINAHINAQSDILQLYNTIIGGRAEFNNRYYTALVENNYHGLENYDVQLYPENTPFYLLFEADRLIFTDANIVNYNPDFILNAPDIRNSFVRQAEQDLIIPLNLAQWLAMHNLFAPEFTSGDEPQGYVIYNPDNLGIENGASAAEDQEISQ